MQPDITDVDVALPVLIRPMRGVPKCARSKPHVDSIATARRHIYIESQYFTSRRIANALGDRLQEANGPEVISSDRRSARAGLKKKTVGVLRNRFVKRLQERDRFGRLRFVYPVLHGVTPCPVFIHSKICIIDDTLARVGSANLTNRSLGLDTECDLAIESGGQTRIEVAIASFRDQLMGEHLGLAPERVEEVVAAEGSAPTAVDSLRASRRGLACVQARKLREAQSLTPQSAIFDPEGPIDPTEVITKALPTEAVQHSRQPLVRLSIVFVLLALLGGLWRWTPLHDWIPPSRLTEWTNAVAAWPLAPLVVGTGIALGSLR